jgi:hypothetical protein
MLPERLRTGRWLEAGRGVTPEPLNVAPELIGRPLATPVRRGVAMGLDLAVVGLLTGVSGLWLLGGLALVVLQLRSRRGSGAGEGLPGGRRALVGWLGALLVAALAFGEAHTQWSEWRHPGSTAVADADDGPSGPAGAASAPAALTAEARIEQLEAELAAARKPRTQRWRDQFASLLDDIGAGLGWGVVYFSLLPAWWGGQTLGKRLLRLQVVELTGKPMTVMRSLKRYGGYAAGLATGGLGLLQVLWDPNRQGLQDKAAHTVVLDLRGGVSPT